MAESVESAERHDEKPQTIVSEAITRYQAEELDELREVFCIENSDIDATLDEALEPFGHAPDKPESGLTSATQVCCSFGRIPSIQKRRFDG